MQYTPFSITFVLDVNIILSILSRLKCMFANALSCIERHYLQRDILHRRPNFEYYMYYRLHATLNFLIGIVGGGVQLAPLGTAATNWPIVPASGDCDDGEIGGIIGRGNRSTRRKPTPAPLCPLQTPTCCPDANPGRHGGKPATNRLSYGTAMQHLFMSISLECALSYCKFRSHMATIRYMFPR
jgi:hypothetical protein